jgi:glycerol-3-phosphate acyltransferase PlsX
MQPSIGRIRAIFDYERVGGSPLLGVRGSVIITHGRARRRMIRYAVDVGATTARTRVPDLIRERIGAAPVAPAGTASEDDPIDDGPANAGTPPAATMEGSAR